MSVDHRTYQTSKNINLPWAESAEQYSRLDLEKVFGFEIGDIEGFNVGRK